MQERRTGVVVNQIRKLSRTTCNVVRLKCQDSDAFLQEHAAASISGSCLRWPLRRLLARGLNP